MDRRELVKAAVVGGCAFAAGVATAGSGRPAPGLEALARFLVHAKREGYASGDEARLRRLDDGGREVLVSAAPYSYRDRWYGESLFSGEEIVWHQGRAAWSLNFYGAAVDGPLPPEFSPFHKRALALVAEDAPFRGPRLYRDGDLVYTNDHRGSLDEFEGVERAFLGAREIFRLCYHGGLLE